MTTNISRIIGFLEQGPANVSCIARHLGEHRLVTTGRLDTLYEQGKLARAKIGPCLVYDIAGGENDGNDCRREPEKGIASMDAR